MGLEDGRICLGSKLEEQTITVGRAWQQKQKLEAAGDTAQAARMQTGVSACTQSVFLATHQDSNSGDGARNNYRGWGTGVFPL